MRCSSARGRRPGRHADGARNSSGSPSRGRLVAIPLRTGLSRNIDAPSVERDRPRRPAMRQGRELGGIKEPCHRFGARGVESDLARVGLAYDEVARGRSTDAARVQHRAVDGQRQRSEEERNGFSRSVSRSREVREVVMQQDSDRPAWGDEERRLEREIAAARERLALLEGSAERQAAEYAAMGRHQSASCAVKEDVVQQRRLREEAERQQARAEAELASLSSAAPCSSQTNRAGRQKLSDLKLELARVAVDRGRQQERIQASLSDLEGLRRELQSLTDENLTLRAGIQRSFDCLRGIQRQAVEAEELAAATFSSVGAGSWRREPLHPAPSWLV